MKSGEYFFNGYRKKFPCWFFFFFSLFLLSLGANLADLKVSIPVWKNLFWATKLMLVYPKKNEMIKFENFENSWLQPSKESLESGLNSIIFRQSFNWKTPLSDGFRLTACTLVEGFTTQHPFNPPVPKETRVKG